MKISIAVALGGALGALSRYWFAQWVLGVFGRAFPYGTLAVNVLGSLLIGVLSVVLVERTPAAVEWRAFAIAGFLGAFTTFSAFSLETLQLIQHQSVFKAVLNIAANVVACLGAAFLGYVATRHFYTNGI